MKTKNLHHQNDQFPDQRTLVRETSHITRAPRAPQTPLERTDQPRKHGGHRGPRLQAEQTDKSS